GSRPARRAGRRPFGVRARHPAPVAGGDRPLWKWSAIEAPRPTARQILVAWRQLFGAEDLVAGVAEAGQDVAVLVETLVDRGGVDLDVGVSCRDAFEAFRCGNQEQALDALAARRLEHVDGGDQGAGGG